MTEFEQKLADIHLSLYHLSLDAETTWEQNAMLWVIMDSFDVAWAKYQEMLDMSKECKEEK